ncbi:hypothetical protein NL676_018051 [Syzygium grande]|nr:hypothetical protein NL676_018051 [Syzygium grande]
MAKIKCIKARQISDIRNNPMIEAVENIDTIIGPALVGKHIANLAGNRRLVLPVPAFNVINGGSPAGNKLAMQKFLILPVGASSFKEAMKMGVEVYDHLKTVIKMKYGQAATMSVKQVDLLRTMMDLRRSLEMLSVMRTSHSCDYAIVAIEDPFDQDDLEHYAKMTDEIGEHVQIVRGDLLGTNLVVDQIGSVTETIEAVKMSKLAGWGVMASCGCLGQLQSIGNTFLPKMFCFGECTELRIGDTVEAFIADLSVGLATLMQIEKELGAEAVYAEAHFRKPVEPD